MISSFNRLLSREDYPVLEVGKNTGKRPPKPRTRADKGVRILHGRAEAGPNRVRAHGGRDGARRATGEGLQGSLRSEVNNSQ